MAASLPRSRRCSATCEPMNPALPMRKYSSGGGSAGRVLQRAGPQVAQAAGSGLLQPSTDT